MNLNKYPNQDTKTVYDFNFILKTTQYDLNTTEIVNKEFYKTKSNFYCILKTLNEEDNITVRLFDNGSLYSRTESNKYGFYESEISLMKDVKEFYDNKVELLAKYKHNYDKTKKSVDELEIKLQPYQQFLYKDI